jgi:hypothetical protein
MKITRLPDLNNGDINYTFESDYDNNPFMEVDYEWDWIKNEASKLKVGESKEY